MKIKFDDHEFSFQLLRVLGSAASRQADVGECLATADRIAPGDFESWTIEWTRTAERVEAAAKGCAQAGHRVSASEAWLRASNYYRAAEFFLHGNPSDPRIADLFGRSVACFADGLRAGNVPHEYVDIAYEGARLPGIFFAAASERRPTLIAMTGFDGTLEGLYLWASAATRRGWHCLVFEGPGQGRVIRDQGLPFRPDWERVVTPVIDCLAARADVDTTRIALLGVSFGGYLAPRAAAFDKRIAACIANGGVLDFIGAQIPPGVTREQYVAVVKGQPERIDAAMQKLAEASTSARWSQQNGMYTFRASSPSDWLRKLLDYDLAPVAHQITCPTLVIDVEHETNFPGEARKLYDALTCPKQWLYFSEEEGAGDHCQTGSPTLAQQRIFDWLEEALH